MQQVNVFQIVKVQKFQNLFIPAVCFPRPSSVWATPPVPLSCSNPWSRDYDSCQSRLSWWCTWAPRGSCERPGHGAPCSTSLGTSYLKLLEMPCTSGSLDCNGKHKRDQFYIYIRYIHLYFYKYAFQRRILCFRTNATWIDERLRLYVHTLQYQTTCTDSNLKLILNILFRLELSEMFHFSYLRVLTPVLRFGRVPMASRECPCRNWLRSPYFMYSTMTQRGSSRVHTPRTRTMLGSFNRAMICTSLWKSLLETL